MILKVNGILQERKGLDGGRIKVLSFKKNGEYFFNQADINNHFPPHGYVFAHRIFEKFDHSIGSIIEFWTSHITSDLENGDVALMDYNKDCKKIGFQVFPIEENILVNDLSINQTILKDHIPESSTHFYIKHRNEIFGPFKWSNGDVIPKLETQFVDFKTSW